MQKINLAKRPQCRQIACMSNTNNAKQAFDQYVMWIANYPGDFKGATEAASDFIDTTEELDQLETLIRKAAGK